MTAKALPRTLALQSFRLFCVLCMLVILPIQAKGADEWLSLSYNREQLLSLYQQGLAAYNSGNLVRASQLLFLFREFYFQRRANPDPGFEAQLNNDITNAENALYWGINESSQLWEQLQNCESQKLSGSYEVGRAKVRPGPPKTKLPPLPPPLK